jgi:hypothetical protein
MPVMDFPESSAYFQILGQKIARTAPIFGSKVSLPASVGHAIHSLTLMMIPSDIKESFNKQIKGSSYRKYS